MQKLDKNRFSSNLRYLAQQKGVKLGELENEAGVSTGYISRLSKTEDNTTSPLVDLAIYASEKFGVSLNSLLELNLSSLLPNEFYLSKFIAKMGKKTATGLLNWTYTTKETITKSAISHPQVYYYGDNGNRFKSAFNSHHTLGDGSAYANIGDRLIYIIQIKDDSLEFATSNGYEVYFVNGEDDQEPEPLFYACETDKLYSDLDKLFKSAMEASHQIKIYPGTRSVIDKFMKDDENSTDDIDLPF